MAPWLFSLILLLAPSMRLVLKDGRVLLCDSYEVRGQMVSIRSGDKQFALPLNRIDLEKSGQVEAVDPPKAEAPVKTQRPKTLSDAQPKGERKPIVLTTKDLKSGSRGQGSSTTRYRKIGNSIIVEVTINGSGPFSILLDTGANTTVLSPELLERLNIARGRQSVSMVGLSGQPVQGFRVTLDSLALAGQSVEDLMVVSFDISHLSRMNVVGLLGQDFLNYFVMSMDNNSQQITLKPHGAEVGPSSFEREQNIREELAAWERSADRLVIISNNLRDLLTRFNRGDSSVMGNASSRQLKAYADELGVVRQNASSFRNMLSQIDLDPLSQDERESVRNFQSCYPEINRYLGELQKLCGSMRNYANTQNKERLTQSLDEIGRRNRAVMQCLQ